MINPPLNVKASNLVAITNLTPTRQNNRSYLSKVKLNDVLFTHRLVKIGNKMGMNLRKFLIVKLTKSES